MELINGVVTVVQNHITVIRMKFQTLVFSLLISISSLWAVEVKYYENVDVSAFANLSLRPSSLVKEIYYKDSENYLIVNLKGTYYHYCKIPKNVVNNWVSSPSLGRYYISNIKGNFDCRFGGIPK